MARALARTCYPTIAIVALSIAAPASLRSQSRPAFSAKIEALMGRYEEAKAAAERDVDLTNEVQKAFFRTADPSSKSDPIAVNRAIAPLKARYPDRRLNYRSSADYCPIERAIVDARVAALKREVQALDQQRELALVGEAFASVMLKKNGTEIIGAPLTDGDVAAAFDDVLAHTALDEVPSDWSSMDYLGPAILPMVPDCE